MRTGGRPRAGTFAYEGDELVTGWHSHDLHQIEYARQGVVEVESATAHYLLPPQQAVWIPAGLSHQTTIATSVRTVSVFFDPDLVPRAGDRARIVGVAPVLREMIIFGQRWPIQRRVSDAMADAYFEVLGHLVAEALEDEIPLYLPRATDPVVAAALQYTNSHLNSANAAAVSDSWGIRTDPSPPLPFGARHVLEDLPSPRPTPPQHGLAGRTRSLGAQSGYRGRLRERKRLCPGIRRPHRRESILVPTASFHLIPSTCPAVSARGSAYGDSPKAGVGITARRVVGCRTLVAVIAC